jgi:hypothetical protein
MDSLHVLPGPSSEPHATTSDGACNFSNIKVEKDIVIKEEDLITLNEEVDLGIKKEEIPEDVFPNTEAEEDEVNYVCMSVIRHILPVSSTVSCFCDVIVCGQLKQLHCWE